MSEFQGPANAADVESLLAMPDGFRPSYDDLLEAVRAYKLWDICEEEHLSTFHGRMDICSYAQWAGDRALGRPHDAKWCGVPWLVLIRDGGDHE